MTRSRRESIAMGKRELDRAVTDLAIIKISLLSILPLAVFVLYSIRLVVKHCFARSTAGCAALAVTLLLAGVVTFSLYKYLRTIWSQSVCRCDQLQHRILHVLAFIVLPFVALGVLTLHAYFLTEAFCALGLR